MGRSDRRFWCRWVLANTLGEALGLGGPLVVLLNALTRPGGPGRAAMVIGLVLLLGAVEGTFVGTAQWLVLRTRLPNLPLRKWILATAAGALTACTLGALPGVRIDLSTPGSVPDISGYPILPIGIALGIMGGLTVGIAQWPVLRCQVGKGWLWVPANVVAWMVATFIIAAAGSSMTLGATLSSLSPAVLGASAVAGVVVGAIHGYALVSWLLPRQASQTEASGT